MSFLFEKGGVWFPKCCRSSENGLASFRPLTRVETKQMTIWMRTNCEQKVLQKLASIWCKPVWPHFAWILYRHAELMNDFMLPLPASCSVVDFTAFAPTPEQKDVDLQLGKVRPQVLLERCIVWRDLLLHHTWRLVPCGCREDPYSAWPREIPGRVVECWKASCGRRRCSSAFDWFGTNSGWILCAGVVQVWRQRVLQDPVLQVFGRPKGLGPKGLHHAWCVCLCRVHRGYLPVPFGSRSYPPSVWSHVPKGHLHCHERTHGQGGNHGLVCRPCAHSLQADSLHHGQVCSAGQHRDRHLRQLANQERELEPRIKDGCICYFGLHCRCSSCHHFSSCRFTPLQDQQEGCRWWWWHGFSFVEHCQRDWVCEALHNWSWTKVHHDWHAHRWPIPYLRHVDARYGSWEVSLPWPIQTSLSSSNERQILSRWLPANGQTNSQHPLNEDYRIAWKMKWNIV